MFTIRSAGYAFITVGVIAFLALGFGLKEPLDAYEPHALRWLYASISLGSGLFFGCVLIGIDNITESLSDNNRELDAIKYEMRKLGQSKEV